MDHHRARLSRLKAELDRLRASAAIIGATDHMRYLVGWSEPPGERLMCLWVPAAGEPALIVPSLYADDASRWVSTVPVVSWHDSDGWQATVAPLLSALGSDEAVLVDDDLAAGHLLGLQSIAPSLRWESALAAMTTLRGVKSSDEIAAMERSAAVADAVFEHAVRLMKPGLEEVQLQGRILQLFAEAGATSAWAIVCFGRNTALPHHRSGGAKLSDGDAVILDLGCCYDGYQSDITRTLAFGSCPSDLIQIYDIVFRAHMAVMDTARPGITCEAVDAAAREVITRAGYGDRFIHRTGHGIGMSTHEPPNLVVGDRTVLQPGMCFSNEPGIYLSGRFGVRIENIITITESGCRSLNRPAPAKLVVV